MQTKGILVCVVLLLPSVGTVQSPAVFAARQGRLTPPHTWNPTGAPELRALLDRGRAVFAAGRYLEAAGMNLNGGREARRQGDLVRAVRFLNNLGSCWFAVSRYRQAMDAYLEARDLAQATGDTEMYGALSLNISSLYLQMGETEGAAQAAAEGLRSLDKLAQPRYRVHLLMQVARVKACQGRLDEAAPLFRAAVAAADREGNDSLRAQAWNLLGYELLSKGRLQEADSALVEAFRLRKLNHDRDLDVSFCTVGLLRMAQGDTATALALLDQAVAIGLRKPSKAPKWSAYYFRGQAHQAQGSLREAVDDFRAALDLARRWRLEIVPADSVRVSMEVELQQLYSAFIQAANRLYRETGRAALVRETFEAAEENRAASLRALITSRDDLEKRLPPRYGEVLAQLRGAEVALLRGETAEARADVQRLRLALSEMEARAGLDFGAPPRPDGRTLLARTQRALGRGEVLLSFHLGEPDSFLWVVTRDTLDVRVLPARRTLAARADAFAAAIRNGSDAAPALGNELYQALFGGLEPRVAARPHWLLALDDALFRVPFAALVAGGAGGRPVFLVERHTLRITPSAHMVGSSPPARAGAAGFVGLGDPIYNTADPRWRGGPRQPALHLPRLAGSGREIRACAGALGAEAHTLLLEGPDASRQALASALASTPGVLHFATHVVSSRQRAGQGLIALSLLPSGEPDFLSAADIAAWRVRFRLVVLSGCSSGLAETPPGAGLMGLTRAWLAAGAEAVAASLWPTPDDSGELFLSFYRHLRAGSSPADPAVALARAQVDMLHSHGWRSLPKYWAAYFVVGKE